MSGQAPWLEEAARRRNEPLHPDLVPWLFEADGLFQGGLVLKHPLVFSVPFVPEWAYQSNDQLAGKREALSEAKKAGAWHTVVWLHERPFRAQALDEIKRKMRHREYWELLGHVWIDTENLYQWGNLIPQLLLSQRPGRKYLMDAKERRALRSMPETLTVYRGYTSPRGVPNGWSWTLDEMRAGWFAHRLSRAGETAVVLEGTVPRARVIAYFTGRNEDEIVTQPKDVLLEVNQ